MSRFNRHPGRTWFGDTPVRTLADKERDERQQNSRVGDGKLAGSVSPRAVVDDAPTLDPLARATTECEHQARSLFADRILQPEDIRKKYPAGWLRAGYVAAPAQLLTVRSC